MTRAREQFEKVNLGSGLDRREDYWNVDLALSIEADESVDVFGPLPWPDESFQQILASDILEHTSWMHTEAVLTEWLRVLAAGGRITIRVPNIRYLCEKYLSGQWDALTASLWIYGGHAHHVGPENWRLNAHFAAFDEQRLRDLASHFSLEVEDLAEEASNLVLVAKKV